MLNSQSPDWDAAFHFLSNDVFDPDILPTDILAICWPGITTERTEP